jgi:tetratricopeptide (TPR) repeat protein
MALMSQVSRLMGLHRSLSSVELFRRADRYRREGQLRKAAELVEQGLSLEPNSIVGRLLAAYLKVARRRMSLAKADFERVLAREADNPRALLGLARIALEEGDVATCTELLKKALQRYPDFPEASALLEATTAPPPPPAAEVSAEAPPFRPDRLRAPADSRDLVLLHVDGPVIHSHAALGSVDLLAGHLTRLTRLGSAALARSGLGPLRRVIVDGASETMFIRTNGSFLLALTHGPGSDLRAGLLEMNTLWGAALEELGQNG